MTIMGAKRKLFPTWGRKLTASQLNSGKSCRRRKAVGHLVVVDATLSPALHSLASISLFQHRAVPVAEVDQAIEHGQ